MAEFDENTETLPEINFSNLSRGDINKIMRENYLEYARHSVKERAMCDIRDGLKPVQRRILYSMLESKLFHNKPYEKVSKRVGYVMGEYHPHGDSSITTALVNMGIPWKMNRSYTDILGNYGSVDGDMHAAARYIETRLTKAGEEFGDDLHKDIVPYEPNYDETKIIPIFLPTKLPQLLINGTEGLAVGIASKILPHNPEEVIESYKYYLENPKATLKRKYIIIDELLALVQGSSKQARDTFAQLLGTVALLGRATKVSLILVSQRFDATAFGGNLAVRDQINCSIILGEINTNTTQFLLPNAHIENIVVPSGIGTGIVKFSDGKHDSNIMPLLTPYYNKRCL